MNYDVLFGITLRNNNVQINYKIAFDISNIIFGDESFDGYCDAMLIFNVFSPYWRSKFTVIVKLCV